MHSRIPRAFLVGICTFTLLFATACKSHSSQEKSHASEASAAKWKPINVVFVTLDTVRADHLHCYGDKSADTPTIDALASSGVLFDKAVTQAPLTLPSHASMFTGTNPNVNHVRDTGGFVLGPSSITLAEILQKHGWDTAAFVSSVVLSNVGFNQGFSVYDDQMPGGQVGQGATRNAGVTVDHALNWLNTQSTQPFFVWLHFYDAHAPYIPPPDAQFRARFSKEPYDAEISYIDQQLGRFLTAVRKKSPPEKTLIVLLTDHGEGLGQHGEYHHGIFLYDSTVRIAWIMSGPGVPAGVRVEQQARTVDVLPTVLDLLGGAGPSIDQGTSVVPAFRGKPVSTHYSYEETMYPKLVLHWAGLRGIHTANWMYVEAPKPELYDLKSDPGELHNVIDRYPKKYRELAQQLKVLSSAGGKGSNKVVTSQMDQQTLQKLRSLGYTGGSQQQTVVLDGSGADPKDMLDVLRLQHLARDSAPGTLSSARRVELYQQALAKDPTNPSLYYGLGDEYEQTGQVDANIQLCLTALKHGINGAMIMSRLGQLYFTKGDLKNATVYDEAAAQLNPTDPQTLSNLAGTYAADGRLDDAEKMYQRALAVTPNSPAYDGLGILAVRRHDFASARKYFEDAVHLNPKDPASQQSLGVFCMQTGDAPCARAAFHAFLANASPVRDKRTIQQVQYALRTVLAPGR